MKAEAVLCAAVWCMFLAAGCRGPGRKPGRAGPAGPAGRAERGGTSADTRVSESAGARRKSAPEAAVAWGEAVKGVRYGLSCDRRSFESGGPISLTVHVENMGDTPVAMPDPAQPSYSFLWRLIFTPSDGGVPFIAQDHAHVRREFRETSLAAGETKTGRIEIDPALLPDTLHIRQGKSGGFVRELPPGRYRAAAEEPGGKVTTGAVEIEIAANREAAGRTPSTNSSGAGMNAKTLRLTISADAKELTTTHLPIQATFENVSDRAVKILERSLDKRSRHIWFWLRMTYDSGRPVMRIRRGGKIQLRGTKDYVTLRPGGTHSINIDAATLAPVLEAGEYRLKLTYVNQYGRDCFRGRLESNTINVTLTGADPEEKETQEAAPASSVRVREEGISLERAVAVARKECKGVMKIPDDAIVETKREGRNIVITFRIPIRTPRPGASYYARIVVNAQTGAVVQRFAPDA